MPVINGELKMENGKLKSAIPQKENKCK